LGNDGGAQECGAHVAKSLFLDGGSMRSANAGFDHHRLNFYDRRYKQMKSSHATKPLGQR
jgi:hypothetical protein